ncbi:MBL fold metallo-hydrolase [Pseudorhodobacter sp. MZDSW-24AT]|uniref:MBL fold metallo-hydrolase n=1 Tax=Pseudorhodobacter sp. MZDSW-24AT TaxID=2052957 RepID=UPI0012FE6742|nr:MBL fold metallo-hydrolase [Pseudorhodobacter sp. MZDSW-24AT]
MRNTLLGTVALAGLMAGPAAAIELEDMIAARQHVFGAEHVNPQTGALPNDKVIFSWLSAASFAASVQGRVVMFDTFVSRLEVERGRTPLTIMDITNIKPDAITVSHGHGDHADNAVFIAAHSGAPIYATEELCGSLVNLDWERMRNDPRIQNNPTYAFPAEAAISCVPVTSTGSTPGTEILNIPLLEPDACVIGFRHLHSVAVPPDPEFPPTPVEIIVDPRDAQFFPEGTPLWPRQAPPDYEPVDDRQFDSRTTAGAPGGAESLFFSVILRGGSNFSFVYQNTAGALKEGKGRDWDGTPEDGQRIIAVLEALGPTDVQLGTAATGNFANNGLRDLIEYQAALKPKIYIPNHITTGTSAKEGSSLSVYAGYVNQMDLMNVPMEDRPRLHWLIDPVDYLKPIVYDVNNPNWSAPEKQEMLNSFCAPTGSSDPVLVSLSD